MMMVMACMNLDSQFDTIMTKNSLLQMDQLILMLISSFLSHFYFFFVLRRFTTFR